jgi:hypothetical protein
VCGEEELVIYGSWDCGKSYGEAKAMYCFTVGGFKFKTTCAQEWILRAKRPGWIGDATLGAKSAGKRRKVASRMRRKRESSGDVIASIGWEQSQLFPWCRAVLGGCNLSMWGILARAKPRRCDMCKEESKPAQRK